VFSKFKITANIIDTIRLIPENRQR